VFYPQLAPVPERLSGQVAAEDASGDRGSRRAGQAARGQPERDGPDRERATGPDAAAESDADESGQRASVRTGEGTEPVQSVGSGGRQ
jgi:hypothetical protein